MSDAYIIVAADLVKTGGMDRANLEFARYVLDRGHELHLVSHCVSAELACLPRVRIYQVPRPFESGLLGERGLDIAGRALTRRLPASTRVLLNGGNCSVDGVNWIHYVHRSKEAAATAVSIRGRAFQMVARWTERRAISRARLIVANSEKTRADLMNAYDLSAVQVHTVHCGLDPLAFIPVSLEERGLRAELLGLRPERKRIAFVGGFADDRKGFAVLFNAMRLAGKLWRDLEVIVVGTGRGVPIWQKKVDDAGLSEQFIFLGRRRDVAELLQASDLVVAPSRYEPYGLNIAEALATGLPVIASSASGASSLMTGRLRDLLLADPLSEREVLEKLRMWRAHENEYRNAALSISKVVRAHDWDAMSRSIYGLVERAYTTRLVSAHESAINDQRSSVTNR